MEIFNEKAIKHYNMNELINLKNKLVADIAYYEKHGHFKKFDDKSKVSESNCYALMLNALSVITNEMYLLQTGTKSRMTKPDKFMSGFMTKLGDGQFDDKIKRG